MLAFWFNDLKTSIEYWASSARYRDMYKSAQMYDEAAKASMAQEAALLRADTYGGKTPEETLALFVDALERGDATLASKYYMPWLQTDAEKELSAWIADDSFKKFIVIYKKGIIKRDESYVDGLSIDIYESEQNGYPYVIKMEQNKEKNLWKITEF